MMLAEDTSHSSTFLVSSIFCVWFYFESLCMHSKTMPSEIFTLHVHKFFNISQQLNLLLRISPTQPPNNSLNPTQLARSTRLWQRTPAISKARTAAHQFGLWTLTAHSSSPLMTQRRMERRMPPASIPMERHVCGGTTTIPLRLFINLSLKKLCLHFRVEVLISFSVKKMGSWFAKIHVVETHTMYIQRTCGQVTLSNIEWT